MNDLYKPLAQIVEKINTYRSIYEKNEAAVRTQVINPVLSYLGWDPGNPEEVLVEDSTTEGKPDYTLIKNGKKVLFIEAKNLSVNIDDKVINQLAKYAFAEGTKYGVVTNGTVWILVKSFPKQIIWEVDLKNREMSVVIEHLTTISKTNIDSLNDVLKKMEKTNILEKAFESFLKDPEKVIKALMSVVKQEIKSINTDPDLLFKDTEIKDFLNEKVERIIGVLSEKWTSSELSKKSPRKSESWSGLEDASNKPSELPKKHLGESKKLLKMKLENEIFELQYKYEIFVNTAEWLIKNGKLKPSDCPIRFKGFETRNLINNEPKHSNGKEFTLPKRLSNGLWIEVYSPTNALSYSRRLLEKFGVSPDTLELEVYTIHKKVNPKEQFLNSLDENGLKVFRRIFEFAERNGLIFNWGGKGFSLNIKLDTGLVNLLFGYPPSSVYKQSIYIETKSITKKVNNLSDIAEFLIKRLENLGYFVKVTGSTLKWVINRAYSEGEIKQFLDIIGEVIPKIKERGLK